MKRVSAVTVLVVVVGLGVLAGAGLALASFTAHLVTPQSLSAADKFGPTPPPTPTPPTPGDDLEVQSRTNDGGASGNRVLFGLRLLGTGGPALDLKKVTLRYWFTNDGGAGTPTAACYQAQPGCPQVKLTIVRVNPARVNADYYLQVGFTGGPGPPGPNAEPEPEPQPAPGDTTTLEQLAILAPPGATYRQDNDFSFLNKANFKDNPKVTAYVDGRLVWGTEP